MQRDLVVVILYGSICNHATIHPPTTIYINEDKTDPNTDNFMIFAILYFYNFILVIDTTVQNNGDILLHFKPMKLILMNYNVFFFFYWRYNPLWVLAFSVIFFHCAHSSHCFLHRLTPIIYKSSSLPTIHLFRGLPLVLVPIGFHCNILLGVLLSAIRIT